MAEPQHQYGLVPAQDHDPRVGHAVVRRKPLPRTSTDAAGGEILLSAKLCPHGHDEGGPSEPLYLPQDDNIGSASDDRSSGPVMVSKNDSSGLLIDTHTPPVLLPGPETYLTNGTHGIDTFTWRVQTYLSRSAGQNFTRFSEERSVGTLAENDIDVFFNHIVWRPNGTAPEHLAGPENQANLIRAVQTLYNKYVCLVIDMKFRQPVNRNGSTSDNNNDMVHGMMQIQRSRLKVNAASKLALQIMLGVMTALGVGAWCLTNLRGTLPRNPCSIASTMALLAGSDLCDGPDPLIPGNALLLSKRESECLGSSIRTVRRRLSSA
ncbi:hypothetical protein CBER1_00112 [Cercospora berteroae]|uniref:Uncharacterized protein n=1 Tax=Cercospora berteroae TaxID=357750 RepID=A0A2S6CDH4_9PEZI|nr:hypothetical protein CBER1_00112 [Cercospora berteroae]